MEKVDELTSGLQSYYRSIGKYPLLTSDEEKRLIANYQTARGIAKVKIREKLITSNLRLVVKIAKDYQGCGIPLSDLVNEGNIGLMKAVEKFKPDKGTKLSYYASFWIKQCIFRSLTNKSRLIRVPCGAFDEYTKMAKFSQQFQEAEGREPTIEELSKKFNIGTSRITSILESMVIPKSLNDTIKSGGTKGHSEKTYAETIEDEKLKSIDSLLSTKEDVDNLKKCLKKLSSRECNILMYRFGLDNRDQETLEKIGERYNVTRERIRQIESVALRKVRFMFDKISKMKDK